MTLAISAETDPVYSAWLLANPNIDLDSINDFTPTTLLADYGFTDNSLNWDAAYTHLTTDVVETAADVNDAETDPVWTATEPNYGNLGQAETLTGNCVNTANPWAVNEGGTGLKSFTAGDVIYSSAANTLTVLAKGTAAQVLTMNTAGTAPECFGGGWQASTTRIQILPTDFHSTKQDWALIVSIAAPVGAYVTTTNPTGDPFTMIAIPAGYQSTNLMVYGNTITNTVDVYVNSADNNQI